MFKWKSSRLIPLAALLVQVPLLVDPWLAERDRLRDLRDDELVRVYECMPPRDCVADFDGDGSPDRLDIVAGGGRAFGLLVAFSGGREVLRLPYDYTDGTLRTHTAIRGEWGRSRLLVYDGASHSPPLRAAFAWDGRNLAESPASELDNEILAAMAAHDDTGGWNERAVFRPMRRVARLGICYTLLAVIAGIVLYRRLRGPLKGVS